MDMASKSLPPVFDYVWRGLAIALLGIVCAEAWYVHQLSGVINDMRMVQSKALDQHLSDGYVIGKLKRQIAAGLTAPAAESGKAPAVESGAAD
jgi:hypothetical protein